MQILFQFDVRTVAFFVAMVFFVQATAIGAQAFLIRDLKQYQGVVAALVANLSVAVGLILRLFANQLPTFLTTVLSNILLLTGSGLFYIALSQFTGFAYHKSIVMGVIGVALSSLVYFTYWADDLRMRMITLSLGSLAMVFILIHQLWRTRKTPLRFSANLMLVSFLLHGFFLMLRTISLILNAPQGPSGITPIQAATYLLSFGISFFWSIGFILMVSQRLRNDLMEVATIDVLTRIPNRRATESFLEKELARAQRNDSEFSVLLIDIDDFKKVNDRWGHLVGDHVLTKTAAIFQAMLRKQDLVGRWGGEEFLVILPCSPSCEPEALAKRLLSEVALHEYRQADETFHITISIGIACADQNSTLDEILRKADNALYKAKITKNAISLAE
jgi:diguanylate cyclase (GGDEF)-like protein